MLGCMKNDSASATHEQDGAGVVEQLERDARRQLEHLAQVERRLACQLLLSDSRRDAPALGELTHRHVTTRDEPAQQITRNERLAQALGRGGLQARPTRIDELRPGLARGRDVVVHDLPRLDSGGSDAAGRTAPLLLARVGNVLFPSRFWAAGPGSTASHPSELDRRANLRLGRRMPSTSDQPGQGGPCHFAERYRGARGDVALLPREDHRHVPSRQSSKAIEFARRDAGQDAEA